MPLKRWMFLSLRKFEAGKLPQSLSLVVMKLLNSAVCRLLIFADQIWEMMTQWVL